MDVSAALGGAPGMDATGAQKAAQAQAQEGQQVKPEAAEKPQQEATPAQVQGLGENIDVSV